MQTDDGVCALGRRLYSTLPEDRFDTGPQSRGEYRMVADVRLDNRPELIAALDLNSSAARGMSDSALLFEALLKWGAAAVQRLVGEFAFALWDAERQELLLGRDFMGFRPLHFHQGKDFFAFGSMPSGLHALPDVPYGIDTDFMITALARLPPAPGASEFRGVMRVEPAHLVKVTRLGISSESHWSPSMSSKAQARSEDFEAGLRHVLDEAVVAQLRGAGDPVASQLSAGLDSTTVTATVARNHSGRVIAFTAVPAAGFDGSCFDGRLLNEGSAASALAQMYPNIDHVLVETPQESPLHWLDNNFIYQQQPMRNLTNAGWGTAISHAARERGATTIFKGGMGNLTISYDGLHWLPYLLSRGHVATAFAESWKLARNGLSLATLAARLISPFVPARLWREVRRATNRPIGLDSYSAVNRRRLAESISGAERLLAEYEKHGRDPFYVRANALTQGDGAGNAFKGALAYEGLSIRDPTADRRVVEFCLSVPFAEFTRGGVPRSLARRAFKDRLPSEITGNRARGLQAADWYQQLDKSRAEIDRELEAILRCPEAREVLDEKWLAETMASWPTGGWNDRFKYARYRLGLLRGISAGHFIRKVAGTN